MPEKVNGGKRVRFMWTKKRIAVLKHMYWRRKSYQTIADKMGPPCNRLHIRHCVKKLIAAGELSERHFQPDRSNSWSPADDATLEELYVNKKMPAKAIVPVLGRTQTAIEHRIQRIGLTRKYGKSRAYRAAKAKREIQAICTSKDVQDQQALYGDLRYEDTPVKRVRDRETISKPAPKLEIARTCLKCQRPFKSWGYGNRLCNREDCRSARRDLNHDRYMVV